MGQVQDREPPDGIVKHFTVAVFVVHRGHVLLHPHPKIGLWLPPGGHIEPHELPDDAALRETVEETGLPVRLVGSAGIAHDAPGSPRQLLRPEGIQVEDISPGHQHIDLIYFAVPVERAGDGSGLPEVAGEDGMQWVDGAGLGRLPVTDEIRHWIALALREVPTRLAAGAGARQGYEAGAGQGDTAGVGQGYEAGVGQRDTAGAGQRDTAGVDPEGAAVTRGG